MNIPHHSRAGAEALRRAIFAESARAEKRRKDAQSTGTVVSALDHDGLQPAMTFDPDDDLDTRPIIDGREPCFRCGIRGNLGCKHQRPPGAA